MLGAFILLIQIDFLLSMKPTGLNAFQSKLCRGLKLAGDVDMLAALIEAETQHFNLTVSRLLQYRANTTEQYVTVGQLAD